MSFNANAVEVQKLPEPDKNSDLMKLINERKSSREYINDRGTRTIATARNEQNLKVYVVYQNSIWAYDAIENSLVKVSDEEIEQYIAKQDFVKGAPVNLIYTGSDKDYSYFHAGSAAQNVYLYATSKGLNTIVRGYIDKDELKDKLRLDRDEFVIINQVIGYPEG